jgi:hypothetical protein
MRRITNKWMLWTSCATAAWVVAVRVVGPSRGASVGQAPPQLPSSAPPPASLAGLHKTGARLDFPDVGVRGHAEYWLTDREVSLKWGWTSSGPEPRRADLQLEPVAFWPTEVAGVGGAELLVAGKRRERTLIEWWRFQPPQLPAPTTDSQGVTSYPRLRVEISKRTPVLDQAVVGQDIAQFLWNDQAPRAPGVQLAFFALFHDSRELYKVELRDDESVARTRVASRAAAPDVLHVPRLGDGFELRWSADHEQFGFAYVLAGAHDATTPQVEALVLCDSDRDGRLDTAITPTAADWAPGGAWGARANFRSLDY